MALQLTYSAPIGDVYPAAYAKVVAVRFTYPGVAEVQVYTYRDAKARREAKSPVVMAMHTATGDDFDMHFADAELTTKQPRMAAYDWLKTLPEYAGATDV